MADVLWFKRTTRQPFGNRWEFDLGLFEGGGVVDDSAIRGIGV